MKFKFTLPQARWQKAAFSFSMAAFSAFLINFSFTLWAITQREGTIKNGVGTLSEQKCSTTKMLNTGIHVIINVLSTILLAGSNYCMQCLMAPSRMEIDDAHSKQHWLDIGVPSVRNLWSITTKKRIIWILLSVSSLPLHLIYNSVIFSSTSVNNYEIFYANTPFLEEKNRSAIPEFMTLYSWTKVYDAFKQGQLEKLTVADCLAAYGTPFQSSRGNLLLISTNDTYPTRNSETATYLLEDWAGFQQSFTWMCEQTIGCDDELPRIKPDEWRPYGSTIKECHSQQTEEHCKILFSSTLLWIVTFINLFKGILMLFVAFGGGRDQPLPILTIGDAVASFLRRPDDTTADMCLKSKKEFTDRNWFKPRQQFDAGSKRKFAAGSHARWTTCIMLYVFIPAPNVTPISDEKPKRFTASLGTCIALLAFGLNLMDGDKSITGMGLGAPHTKTTISIGELGQGSLVPYILLANLPQVIFSVLYFTYNALFTNLSLVTEWDRFGDQTKAKGLRVSSKPQGSQRDTYFLQLPYRYSIPLLACSGVLHWLISQSLFLVDLEVYGPAKLDPMEMVSWATERAEETGYLGNLNTCGWSPAGVICVIVLGLVMVGFLLASAWRRLRFGGIPVAGSCSAAISAACHPNLSEKDISGELLRWGVVDSEGDERQPGHCSFSARPVRAPVQGQYYQ